MLRSFTRAVVGCALGFLTACGGGEPGSGEPDGGGIDASPVESDAGGEPDADAGADDASDALFRPDHVLEVEITMDAGDWEVLRHEPERLGMPHATCAEPDVPSPYHYHPGTISIDGVVTTDVGVRKKGNLGSISSERPGLKVKANEYVRGQRIFALEQLTLNNNEQDPSRISQCLGYGLFREAGVPAPRCSFAHVVVNGEDLGVYSNVESVKETFLEREFGDGEGRLYESGGDFVPGGTLGFQPKTDEESPDCSDLDGVVAALQAPDGELRGALDAVVDVEAFTTFWAMEVITDHWDGYANNRNNFFLYHDPLSDRFHFIPWGIDALFAGRERTTRPMSVFACASLPWRLYDVAETRNPYLARMRELLETVWDENAILDEIARMDELVTPVEAPGRAGELAEAIERTREFVRTRADVLRAELDAGTPVWPYPAGEASCWIDLGTVTATFETSWGSLDVWDAGSGTTEGSVAGVSVSSATAFASAGPGDGSSAMVRVLAPLADGRYGVLFILLQEGVPVEAGEWALDLVNVAAIMTFFDPATNESSGGGLLFGGTLRLDEASREQGATVRGTITGDVIEL